MDKKERNLRPERRSSPRKKPSVLQNLTNKRMVASATSKRGSLEKGDTKLNLSRTSDKAEPGAGAGPRRRSGGEAAPAPGELSDLNKRKLRVAVYNALHIMNVEEKNPLFKKCFPKLFNICKMYVLEGCDE